ncbi:alanine/glycine:cation symporter family protein [Helicobacter kayseriensis]|uniref:alanine/glycine:cation symporter family protein n=1 Tax=Helicobacter kayseriensis TaxID=2905877 RepID=UPI001E5EA1C7|nr:alanine/glycine:cation symporter family protein [Helicobacter kayseriensis]MCE3047137.1 alanine:cation symporter family protein [Helicobacter kayseriensis]MCE3048508.1 alanine:cation symporter family protein [Helicobacter kayseriensis]
MEKVVEFLNSINTFAYGYYLVGLLIIVSVFYSFKLKFVQVTMLKEGLRVIAEKPDGKSDALSSFQALAISVASRVGIGNIAGIAVAVMAGGAGSIFWMWVMAFFGGASAFAESTLAQIYKSHDGNGFKGGPAYYMQKALNQRWLGILFAIILILTYAFGFNGLQSYTMTSAFAVYYHNPDGFEQSHWTIIIGLFSSVIAALLFFGKSSLIGKINAYIVPAMALFYIALALIVTFMNLHLLPEVLSNIFAKAFDFKAIFGGFAGSAVVIGIKRGLFATEAGMGSAPNAAASAHTSHPVKQGLVQAISVLIGILICSSTAFLVLFSQAYFEGRTTALPLVQKAMGEFFGSWGLHFVSIAVVCFAITSLLGNYYYAQANIKYLTNSKLVMWIFNALAVAMVFIGSQMNLKLAWELADVLMAVMATLNIIAILLLSHIVKIALKDYLEQRKKGIEPKFDPKKLGIKNTECWE